MINKLAREIRKKNNKKCVGFGYINSNASRQYFLALSGVKGDYDGQENISWKNTNKQFTDLQNELMNFMTGNSQRKVVLAKLNDDYEALYKNQPTNIPALVKLIGANALPARLFSCVERKILYSGFNGNVKNTVINVSQKPCAYCRPFIKGIDICYLDNKMGIKKY